MLLRAIAAQDEQFHRAFTILASGIEQKAFPGASVAVTHNGSLVALKAFGRLTYESTSSLVTPETVYDLASITKVIATAAACMVLYQRGLLNLGRPLIELVPEFAGDDPRRSAVTLRLLLAHCSGLPAHARLFTTADNKDELVRQAARIPLTAGPGERAEYSDIGFILLGVALERLTQEPLDRFCQREVFDPHGLRHITFNPALEVRRLIPPTIDDIFFRHSVIQGEVNDENAWAMGGVAGHAGCFAPAEDVALFAESMLRGGAPLFQPTTVHLFTQRQEISPGLSRALAWDTPSHPSQSGRHFSPHAFGHLGYTGTSLWIDPDRRLSVTLLTNRTWPDASAQAIKQIRPAFHDAVVEATGEPAQL